MAERRRMIVEVHADMGPFQAQVRAGLASVGSPTVPVASPVGATVASGGLAGVPGVGVAAGGTQQAVAAAMAQAQASASPYAMQAAFGGMATAQRVDQSWDDAAFEQFLGRAPGSAATAPTARPVARGRGLGRGGNTGGRGFLGGAGLIRTLIASELVAEASNAVQVGRQAESDLAFAGSVEERYLIRAQAVERQGNGVIGRVMTFIPDLIDDESSPARMLREAKTGVQTRDLRIQNRDTVFRIAEQRAYRAAFGSGGDTAGNIARMGVARDAEIARLEDGVEGINTSLNAGQWRVAGGVKVGSRAAQNLNMQPYWQSSVTGEARNELEKKLTGIRDQQQELRDQTRFETDRIKREADRFTASTTADARRFAMIAAGGSSRSVARQGILDDTDAELRDVAERYGGMSSAASAVLTRRDAQLGAIDFANARADRNDLAGLRSSSIADNYRAGGQNFQASLVDQQAATNAAVNAEAAGANRPDVLAAIRNAGASQRNSLVGQQNRQFVSTMRGLGTSAGVMQNLLGNNPLGAQIAGIRGNRDEVLAGVTDTGFFGDLQRGAIQRNADLQEQLANRDFGRMRSDVNRRLSGAIEREQLGISGGPTRGIRQAISSIIEQTDMDVRAMGDQGLGPEGDRRKELGRLQLRGAQADFYRSIQYREGSPRGVYGTGTLGGVGSAFKDADEQIGKTGRGETGGAAGGGWTPQQVGDALKYLQQMAQQGIAALAG